jgi:hypothetical protein
MDKPIFDPMAQFHAELARYRAAAEVDRPLLEGALRYAELAIKHLFLLTGGAAIALLAFTGNALNGSRSMRLEAVADAVWWCGYAAAVAVLVSGFSYLAQISSRELTGRLGEWTFQVLRIVAIALWFASLGMFLHGVNAASSALTTDATSSIVPTPAAKHSP